MAPNDMPTRSAIESLRNQQRALEARENELFHEFAKVRDALKVIRDQITEYTNRLSPIATLPNEILSHIFWIGQAPSSDDDDEYEYEYDDVKTLPFEMLVSHVSHHWRGVALGAPSLWTNIKVRFPFENTDFLDIYLERSRACLLDISIALPRESRPADEVFRCTQLPLEHLARHISRWSSLTLESWCLAGLNVLLKFPSTLRAPQLHHLALSLDDDEDDWEEEEFVLLIQDAPLLSSVVLSNLDLSCFKPISTLDSLCLVSTGAPLFISTYQDFYTLLIAPSSLVSLSLDKFAVDLSRGTDPPLTLPSLKSLAVTCPTTEAFQLDADYIYRLFCILTMPSLDTLHILNMGAPQLQDFVRAVLPPKAATTPSQPKYHSLRSLKLDFVGKDDSLDPEFINALPIITCLTLYASADGGYRLTSVFEPSPPPPAAPMTAAPSCTPAAPISPPISPTSATPLPPVDAAAITPTPTPTTPFPHLSSLHISSPALEPLDSFISLLLRADAHPMFTLRLDSSAFHRISVDGDLPEMLKTRVHLEIFNALHIQ